MKKISSLLCLLTVLGLYSCSQEDAFLEDTPSKSLTAGIPAYEFDSETRIGISENLNSFTWSNGDQIGIYHHTTYNDASAVFRINKGGSSSGVFSNESFSLKPNSTYYAFYPYDSDATVDSYPVDFTGQVQTANGSSAHIGERNYMSAKVNTDEDGNADISFKNLASVIQIKLPIQETGIYTSVTITSTGNDFILRGTLDMNTGKFNASEKGQKMELSLGTGIAISKGDMFTANILVAPTDLSGKDLKIVIASKFGDNRIASITGKAIQAGKAYRFEKGEINEIPYLTFTAEGRQTLEIPKPVESLEYSVNGRAWQTLAGYTVTFGGSYGELRLRGKSSFGTAKNATDYSQIEFGNDIPVASSGDIRTLLDYENYKTVSTKNVRFCRLFEDCTNLTTAPELPATTLASSCYSGMFSGCTSLTTAPELPATTLESYCYSKMFSGCTSLTTAPGLPATTLESYCYSGMFYNCTSLLKVPAELPATTLADYCYKEMFKNCYHLLTAPELPATTLAESCYYEMFLDCYSLTTAPAELPATKLKSSCYEAMFSRCESLTTAPKLPATTLAERCYFQMFEYCRSLTIAPELPAPSQTSFCYTYMFDGCIKLNYIKMMASFINLPSSFYCFSSQVSSTGTFVKNAKAHWNDDEAVDGHRIIPEGWTIEYATE